MKMRDASGRFISPKKVPQTAKVKVWVDKQYAGTKEDMYMGEMSVSELHNFARKTGQTVISKSITI